MAAPSGSARHTAGIGRAVGLAERVAAGNERNGLFVVHRHAGEGFADIPRRGERIGIAVGAFRIHVNQTHLNGAERIVKFTIAFVAFVAQPLLSGPQ